jgi:hypothetical protein
MQTQRFMKTAALSVSLLLALLGGDICAQTYGPNLVPNPSFEAMTDCPTGLDNFWLVNSWYNPYWTTPDIFAECGFHAAELPNAYPGYTYPYSGNVCAGLVFSRSGWNEYIQVELLTNLSNGKRYEVSFYLKLAEGSGLALVSPIGVLFTYVRIIDTLETIPNDQFINLNPQVSTLHTNITVENIWIEIKDTIIAVGGEKFITIGNFNDIINTQFVNRVGGVDGLDSSAYYYIDDVSVVEIFDTIDIVDTNIFVSNIITPNGDGINDLLAPIAPNGYTLLVYDRYGRKMYEGNTPWLPDDNTNTGVYIAILLLKQPNGILQSRTLSITLLR